LSGRRSFVAPLRVDHDKMVRKPSVLVVLRNPNAPDVLDAGVAAVADVGFTETITVDPHE